MALVGRALNAMRFFIEVPEHRTFDENESTRRIAVAARHVFIKSGGSSLSIRHVAREADMSVGAVQNFYPRREQLVAALLEFVVNEYEAGYQRILAKLPFNGEARLTAFLEYMATDLLNQETRQFFYSLWALSSHNQTAESLVNAMYEHHCKELGSFVAAARPDLSEEDCFRAALQLSAVMDGLMIFTAPSGRILRTREAVLEVLQHTIQKLVAAK